jgi:hypothetical protein
MINVREIACIKDLLCAFRTYCGDELSHRQELAARQFDPLASQSLPKGNSEDLSLQCLHHLEGRKQHSLVVLRKNPEPVNVEDYLPSLKVVKFLDHSGMMRQRKENAMKFQTYDIRAASWHYYPLMSALTFISLLPKISWTMCNTSEEDSSPLSSLSYRSKANTSRIENGSIRLFDIFMQKNNYFWLT